jgi:hypothetical protein
MPKNSIDYSNTIIYKIYCKDECITDIYVGHTTNFIQRKSSHKVACNNKKNDFKIYKIIRENGGWDNWNMIEIATYNCNDSTEARIKENEHYNQLKATLNSFPPYVDKNNYFCLTCNLHCSSPNQYETHLQSVKHNNLKEDNINNKEYNDTQKLQEIDKNFICELCHYICSKKSDFNKHLLTNKHKSITNSNIVKQKVVTEFVCKNCNKSYKVRNSLWYHELKCKQIICNKSCDDIGDKYLNKLHDKDELIIMLIKENTEFKNMMMEQQNIMMKIIEKWDK